MSSSVVVAADAVLSLSSIYLFVSQISYKNSLLIQAMKIIASFL